MITALDQYKHLSPYALQYASVKGQPYCVRLRERKNLPPVLSEDEAYIKEAVSEREYFLAESGIRAKFVQNSEMDMPAIDDSRILRIDPNAAALLTRLFAIIDNGACIDIDRYENTEPPRIIFEALNVRYDGVSYPSFWDEQNDIELQIEEELSQRDEDIKTIQTDLQETISKKNIERETRLNEKDEDLQAQKTQYGNLRDEAQNTAREKRENDLEAENARHESVTTAIDADEKLENWEKSESRSKEDAAHLLNTLSIENEFAASIRTSDDEYLVACRDAEETINAEKDEINKQYDAVIADAKTVADRDIAERMAKSYDDILPPLFSKLVPYGNSFISDKEFSNPLLDRKISRIWDKYLEDVNACRITKSLTAKWFSRNLLYTYASTPLDRAFADLERMRSFFIGYDFKCTTSSSGEPKELTTLRVPPVKNHSTQNDNVPDFVENSHPLLGHNIVADIGLEREDHEYHYYYGRRLEVDNIDAIYVDVLISHEASDKMDSVREHFLLELEDEKKQYLDKCLPNGKAVGKWEFVQDWAYIERSYYRQCGDTVDLTEGEIQTLKDSIDNATSSYQATASELVAQYIGKRSLKVRLERLKFVPKDKPNLEYYNEIDYISDSLQTDVYALEDKLRKGLLDLQITLDTQLHDAEKKYNQKVAAANSGYQQELLTAQGCYVDRLQSVMEATNTKIHQYLSDGENVPLEVYQELWTAMTSAEDEYRQAKANASATKKAAIADADDERQKTINAAKEQYSDNSAALRLEYTGSNDIDGIDGKITIRKKEAQDAIDEVYKKRNDRVKALDDGFKSAVDDYKSSLQEKMDEINENALAEISNATTHYTYDYYTLGGIKCIRFVATEEATEDDKKEIISVNNRVYSNVSSLLSEYEQFYNSKEIDLKRNKYEIPPLMPFARQRFACTSIIPSDNIIDHPPTDIVAPYRERQIIQQVLNVVVKAKPRTLTNMDLSDYSMEIDELMGKGDG